MKEIITGICLGLIMWGLVYLLAKIGCEIFGN